MLPIALALAQFAPMIAGWLGGPKAEEVAGKVVGIAQQVTGQSSPDATVAALAADPNLSLQFQKAVLDQQAHLAEIAADVTKAELATDTAQVQAVNTTMQAEVANSANESWYQKGWRPFNGYVVGLGSFIGVCFTCYLFYVAIVMKDATAINIVPQLASALAMILAVPGAAVGITAWHRGVMQRVQANSAKSESSR
jgi:roadblock/LC7 domain-containing protein